MAPGVGMVAAMTAAVISAIPTRYAGCHFRSRLEARWAVFFDRLGIDWEYEPQGFEVGGWTAGLRFLEPRNYLPDFYLPGLGLWVEVKGAEAQLDRDLLLAAVLPETGLPPDPWGAPFDVPGEAGDRLLILGPVKLPVGPLVTPDKLKHKVPLHTVLHFWKGRIDTHSCVFEWDGTLRKVFDGPEFGDDADGVTFQDDWKLLGLPVGPWTPSPIVVQAYTAALSSRFEHGQSGPT